MTLVILTLVSQAGGDGWLAALARSCEVAVAVRGALARRGACDATWAVANAARLEFWPEPRDATCMRPAEIGRPELKKQE